MKQKELEDRAYKLYKIDWVIDRETNLFDVIRLIAPYYDEITHDDIKFDVKLAIAELKNAKANNKTGFPAYSQNKTRYNWMYENEYDLKDLWIDAAKYGLRDRYDEEAAVAAFDKWEEEGGFDDGIYVCKNEFLDNEYEDDEIMGIILAKKPELLKAYSKR